MYIALKLISKTMNKKQIYLKVILEQQFHSELCRQNEADKIICLLKDNGINTDKLELDYKFKFEESFELIK